MQVKERNGEELHAAGSPGERTVNDEHSGNGRHTGLGSVCTDHHWTIAVAFFVAYFTEDEALTLHVWAGYTIGVLVAVRVFWGVIGPRYARFVDFV